MLESTEDEVLLTTLPAKHRFMGLLIDDMLQRTLHASVSQTLSELRVAYWIVKKTTEGQVLHSCIPRINNYGEFLELF